ncbi:MAG: hypothetical protein ACYSVY_15210 [Planctomycetota bacterium]|jgi:large-conductance mechanosensitive channel
MSPIVSTLLFLAQTETPEEYRPIWAILISVLPWLIVFAFIWFVVWKRVSRDHRRAQERTFAYMDREEAKTDEMIELLKQINDKLDRSGS